MSLSRWLSLVVGLTSALLVGALLFCHRWLDLPHSPVALVLLALGAGTLMAILAGMLASRWEGQLERITGYVVRAGAAEGRPTTTGPMSPPAVPGLDRRQRELAEAVQQAVGALRKRVEQLAAQKRELEVQLRISDAERRHAEAILNSISDAVLVTDAFNELALANQAAARVLGFDLEQARRKPVEQIVTDPGLVKMIKDTREGGPAAPGLRRHLEHRRGTPQQPQVFDVSFSCVTEARPAGQALHAGGTMGPSGGGGGGSGGGVLEAAGVVTILRDITREREIAEMKSDFVSHVSHELRTPLSSIKAYVEMLVDGEANDEDTRAEFYNIIQEQTNRLQRLIDNILNISRIESGVVKVQREHICLNEVIRDVLEVMRPQARTKQIELEEVPTPIFFRVFADKDMIHQATLNLVSNAIKYTPQGGKVIVAIAVDEAHHRVSVSVTDSGVGISPENLPRLFEKFYRVPDHHKMAKGSGLGLNLVKQVIETVHGGKVTVSSTVGKGSTFTYSLPMAEER